MFGRVNAALFLGPRPIISESHREISTRVPFCIAGRLRAVPDAEQAKLIRATKDNFCILVVGQVMNPRLYWTEALHRHTFWRLISEASGQQCKRLGC